jgi:hypothetical protein
MNMTASCMGAPLNNIIQHIKILFWLPAFSFHHGFWSPELKPSIRKDLSSKGFWETGNLKLLDLQYILFLYSEEERKI